MSKDCITSNMLETKITDSLTWRRKELSVFFSHMKNNSTPIQKTLYRSFIPFLYAHWEGHIKTVSTYYLQHVSLQALKYKELQNNFLFLKFKTRLDESRGIFNFKKGLENFEYLLSELDKRAYLPYKNIVDTKSNLNYEVFSEIIYLLALKESDYDHKKDTINELVMRRNHIAHGEYLSVRYSDCESLYTDIDILIKQFSNDLVNCAVSKHYIK